MDHKRQITQMFHDEHLVTVSTLDRFDALLQKYRKRPPGESADDPEFDRALRDLEALIASDVVAHFAFEEESLFPLLAKAGDQDMSVLLAEEHNTIRDSATSLTAVITAVRKGKISDQDWSELRQRGLAFIELMLGHIQKEEMGLLLTLDDVLDEQHDAELVMDYSALR